MESTIEIRVRGYHLDMFAHVNNARYLEFMEEGRWAAFEASRLTPAMFAERGWTFVVVNININYRYQAGYGDVLVVQSRTKEFGNRHITMEQILSLKGGDRVVVDALVTFVVYDRAGDKAVPIDETIRSLWSGVS